MARKRRTTPRVIVVKKELQKKLNKGITRRQIEKEANLSKGSVHFFLKRYKGVAKRKSILEKLERYLKTDSTIQPKSKGVITIFSNFFKSFRSSKKTYYANETDIQKKVQEMMNKPVGEVEKWIEKVSEQREKAIYGDVCVVLELAKKMGVKIFPRKK